MSAAGVAQWRRSVDLFPAIFGLADGAAVERVGARRTSPLRQPALDLFGAVAVREGFVGDFCA